MCVVRACYGGLLFVTRRFRDRLRSFGDEVRLEASIARHKLSDPASLKVLLRFVLIVSFILFLSYFFSYVYVNADELLRLVIAARGFAPLLIILLIIIEVVVAPLPSFVVTVGSGYLYGPFLGGLYSYIGNVIGSLLAYWLARRFGRPFVEMIISHRLLIRYDGLIHRARHYLVLLYALPVVPVDILSFVAGLSRLSPKYFLFVVLVGFIPNILLLSSFGGFLNTVSSVVLLVWFVVFLVVFGLLAALFRWLARRLSRE